MASNGLTLTGARIVRLTEILGESYGQATTAEPANFYKLPAYTEPCRALRRSLTLALTGIDMEHYAFKTVFDGAVVKPPANSRCRQFGRAFTPLANEEPSRCAVLSRHFVDSLRRQLNRKDAGSDEL
jgi:hypothetical protein